MIPAVKRFLGTTYGGLPAVTWLCSLAAFVNRAGSMVLPFLSLYLGKRFGLDAEEAGMVLALYGIGSTIGNVLGGSLADRIGPVRMQIGTLVGAALWMALMTRFQSVASIAAGTFVLGMLNDAFRPGNMAAVLASVPAHQGPLALTLNRVAVNAGWAIGPTVGGFLAKADYEFLFFADGGTCALAALVLWFFVPRSLGDGRARTDEMLAAPLPPSTSPWRDTRFLLLLLANVTTLLAFMQYFSTESRYLADAFACTEDDIGLLLAINPVLIVLFEMPLVRSLRGRPPLPFVAFGTILIGLAFPILAVPQWGLPGVVAQMALITIGEMFSFSPLGGFIGQLAPESRRGQYLGLHGAAFSFAFVLAPWLGGRVYVHLGADVLWYGCFALTAVAATGYWLMHRAAGRAAGAASARPGA